MVSVFNHLYIAESNGMPPAIGLADFVGERRTQQRRSNPVSGLAETFDTSEATKIWELTSRLDTTSDASLLD